MYVHGVQENASDFFIVGVDEELQTLVVTAVDNVLLQSLAVGIEMRRQVASTHATLDLVETSAAKTVIVQSTAYGHETASFAC